MGVQEDDEESDGEWRDEFPYETNIFSLSNYYNIEGRVATNKDAVVYKATVRKTGLFSLLSSPLLSSPHTFRLSALCFHLSVWNQSLCQCCCAYL